jgi:hypothetical protein
MRCEMAIKITISKQMVACDQQKTALVCFWSVVLKLANKKRIRLPYYYSYTCENGEKMDDPFIAAKLTFSWGARLSFLQC